MPSASRRRTIGKALDKLTRIPGRAERIEAGQDFAVVVDYAHTPDSLTALYDAYGNARKICVLGSTGGGRDTWKRPVMGAIADARCDTVILTNEDPYDEDPRSIVEAVARGMKRAPLDHHGQARSHSQCALARKARRRGPHHRQRYRPVHLRAQAARSSRGAMPQVAREELSQAGTLSRLAYNESDMIKRILGAIVALFVFAFIVMWVLGGGIQQIEAAIPHYRDPFEYDEHLRLDLPDRLDHRRDLQASRYAVAVSDRLDADF